MKKILISCLIFICLFLALDYFAALREFIEHTKSIEQMMSEHKDNESFDKNFFEFNYSLRLKPFKKIWEEARNCCYTWDNPPSLATKEIYKKPSIIVFGCSFAEGAFLDEFNTFEYKLSEATKRPVYNRGFSSFGIPEMLWQTKHQEFYEDIKTEPEYAIYIYISDHLRRIYESKYAHNIVSSNVYLNYEVRNEKLVEEYSPLLQLNRFYIVKNFMKNIIFPKYMLNKENDDNNFDLIKIHFRDAKLELQKRYPNIKFIIIKHPFGIPQSPDDIYSLEYSYTTSRWKELEDEGFIIIDLKDYIPVDLREQEYTFPDGHPNAKAWDLVTEKIVKDLKL